MLSEFIKVCYLFVVWYFLILKEIDKNSIWLSLCHAVLFVIHLEMNSELLVQNSLKFVLVSYWNQTVVEDTHYFVTPEFYQVLFCVLVRLLSLVAALKYFTNITHVENIMRLSRGRQELLWNTVEKLDSCDS